jgi:hypothetical protein
MAVKRHDKSRWFNRVSTAAGLRVGHRPQQKMVWLLDFAQRTGLGLIDDDKVLEAGTADICYFAAPLEGWNTSVRPAVQAADLDSFAIFVRAGLADLFDGKHWNLWMPARAGFARSVWRSSRGDVERQYRSENPFIIARWRAQELIADNLAAIGRCRRPACRRFFRLNKRQEYCGPQCSHIERSAKWRRQHPDQARRVRHETYKRKIAREKGAAAAKQVGTRIREP